MSTRRTGRRAHDPIGKFSRVNAGSRPQWRRELSFVVRRELEHLPRTYLAFLRWRGADISTVWPGTHLVISGYPGSGNSYLRAAILFANPDLSIASHAHSWTEVAVGVRHRKPVVFVTREPRAAIVSHLTRFQEAPTIKRSLAAYARMYERVYRLRDEIVLASFEEATAEVGKIVDRLNLRFGCAIDPFDDEDGSAVQQVLSRMKEYDLAKLGGEAAARGSTPSTSRDALKETLWEQLDDPALRPQVQRCTDAWAALAR